MKKFLSLALALVMTMSLVVVGAGAKDFTDDSKIAYSEAVDVISACGIIDGYTDGSFNPNGTLTRGAAAKIICNMILGPTTAGALSADAAPFADVPANHVFAGYIAYCSQQGIINGYADGTFKPAGTLTGYQFMKMLLGALGYEGKYEGFTGANWSINVAKLALNLELEKGNDEFVGTKAVTREEACLYAFNTLKATMVEYDENTQIAIGDVVITTTSKAKPVEGPNSIKGKLAICDKNTVQFAEKYFGKLTGVKAGETDSFGRPSVTWKYDGDKIGTYADSADDTLLVEKSNISVTTALTGTDYLNLKDTDVLAVVNIYVNGVAQNTVGEDDEGEEVITWDDADDITLYAGDFIETFEDANDKVQTVVVTRYQVAKIDSVEDELASADSKKGATYEIELKNLSDDFATDATETFYDKHDAKNEMKGFDAKTYVKDAVLAIVYKDAATATARDILASNVAETVEGKITAYTSKHNTDGSAKEAYITLAGTKYPVAGTVQDVMDDADFGFSYDDTEYTLYLDPNGYVIGVKGDTSVALEDVYAVTGFWTVDGKWGESIYVEAVAVTTGEVKEFTMHTDDENIKAEEVYDDFDFGGLYTFRETKGKNYAKPYADADKVEALTGDDLTIALKKDDTKLAGYYFDDETLFVKVEADGAADGDNFGGNAEVKKATGSTNVATTADAAYVFYTEDGKTKTADYVVIISDDITTCTEASDIVYFSDDSTSSNKDGNVGEAYFMDGTGKVEDVTYDDAAGKAIGGTFFKFTVDDDGIYTLTEETAEVYEQDGFAADKKYDDETGYVTGVTLTNLYKSALSGYKKVGGDYVFFAEDVKLGGKVVIIDERTSDDRQADTYKTEITSASKLAAAIAKEDSVIEATVFFDDKEVIFVAVTNAQ